MTTQSVGLTVDITQGSHTDTEVFEGKIRLKKINATYDSSNVYSVNGNWVSEEIDLVDRYLSLENLSISSIVDGSSTFKAYTRTSNNQVDWDEYIEINSSTGKMLSNPQRYIQIKVDFLGKTEDKVEVVSNFDSTESSEFVKNDFVEFDGELKLKRDYTFKMTKDNTWSDEGYVFRKQIIKSNYKKIDSLQL